MLLANQFPSFPRLPRESRSDLRHMRATQRVRVAVTTTVGQAFAQYTSRYPRQSAGMTERGDGSVKEREWVRGETRCRRKTNEILPLTTNRPTTVSKWIVPPFQRRLETLRPRNLAELSDRWRFGEDGVELCPFDR